MGKIKINWWSKYSLEVFKRPASGDRTSQSVHTAKQNMMMIIWRVIYSWHDYRTGLTPSKSLICIWMACHALVWSRQEQRYEEFKSGLSTNLNVQIWCKYFGPKSALLRFFFFSFALSDVVCNKRGQRYEEFKSGKCTACQMPKSATLLSCVV